MLIPYQWLKEYVEMDLPPAELGDALTMMGLEVEAIRDSQGEPVFDISVTPNRGDALSVVGVAREAAAALDLPLKERPIALAETDPAVETLARVEIVEPDLCPRYSARVVTGTSVGASPQWAQKRLLQCGMRPINTVVDATNLVMLELGQPLHAFDYDLIKPDADTTLRSSEAATSLRSTSGLPRIIVRLAEPGEYLMTLDGAERRLAASMLVIADPERAIALAGVMGGANSEVNNETTRVLLESAHFDRITVRRTAKALGVPSEAAYRFERIVDPGGTVRALDRVAQMIVEFSGGQIARGVLDENPKPILPVTIELRPARANALLGTDIPPAEMGDLLRRLQLEVRDGDPLVVTVPTFRPDLQKEIDLVEEVARVHGYDNIPTTLAHMPTMRGRQSLQLEIEERARRSLQACGLCEAMTYSLEDAGIHDRLNLPADDPLRSAVVVKNPKSDDFTQLRTTMLSSMVQILATNARRGVADVHAFEIARVFLPRGANELPDERRTVGVAVMGSNWTSGWNLDSQAARSDFFTLKGVAQALADEFAPGCGLAFEPLDHPTFQPGRAASARLGQSRIALLGEVAQAVAAHYDLGERAFVMELDLEALAAAGTGGRQARPISRFPAVRRDLALVVSDDTPAERIAALIRDAGGDLLEELALFDVYRGKQVAESQKSLAYALTFRRMDRTLTDDEADAAVAAIVDRLRRELDARLRE